MPVGKPIAGMVLLVVGAVVPNFKVTDCVPLPLIGTEELDSVQVGAGVTFGVITQLKFTVPANDAIGITIKLKLASPPAFIVSEVVDPAAELMTKFGFPPGLVFRSTPIPPLPLQHSQEKAMSARPSPFMSVKRRNPSAG